MSFTFRTGHDYTLEADESMRIEMMCKELRKENDILKKSLSQEKPKSTPLIRSLESDANAASESRHKDKKYIDELESELRNCSQEIGYLQDQLNLRIIEADCMGEHVHSLELKLAEAENLNEKLRRLNEELEQTNSKCLILEEELHNSFLQLEKLEAALSFVTLESQCEIESMKLDITDLEQRCSEAESLSQQAAQDKSRMDALLEEFEFNFEEAQVRIDFLEKENKELSEKLMMYDRNAKGPCKAEHLDNWLNLMSRMNMYMPSGFNQDFLANLSEELTYLKAMGTCEEVLGPIQSKLAILTTWDGNAKKEREKMSSQIHESEFIIKQLKDALGEEKQKAKEEAEDLIQAMAELRYQITGMLEEECKHRACIEQTSLQRIQDLEAQVRKEQKKSLAAHRRFQEAHELAETQSMVIRNLKHALEGLHQSATNKETCKGVEPCCCGNHFDSNKLLEFSIRRSGDAEASDDICNSSLFDQALLEWHPPDEAPAGIEVQEDEQSGSE